MAVIAFAGAAAGAGAIAGLALPHEAATPPPRSPGTARISGGGLTMALLPGWHVARAAAQGPLILRHDSRNWTIVAELRPARSPSLLPAGVRPRGRTGTLVRGVGDQGRRVVFAQATTAGVLTVSCRDDDPSPSAGLDCVGAAGSAIADGARVIAPGDSAALRSAVPAVVGLLQASRRSGRAALRAAHTPGAQAAAAATLASDHQRAADALQRLTPRGGGAPGDLVRRLRAAQQAYADLAAARTPAAFRAAASRVEAADLVLRRALAVVYSSP